MQHRIRTEIARFTEYLARYKAGGLRIMASSSFQWHSIPMLHIMSQIDPEIPVYFLNTGFHFPQTIAYKNQIAALYGLRVIDLVSPIAKSHQLAPSGHLMWAAQPDHCCHMNKTLPMEPILASHDVWITGVRRDQNENRRSLGLEERGKFGILRFHPMLHWTQPMIDQYLSDESIPPHPLEAQGYHSVGCMPCTQKPNSLFGADREGRWAGLKKTECGLHTELIDKQA